MTVSVGLRVESSHTLCMLGNVFILPSTLTTMLLAYKLLSLKVISFSILTSLLLSFLASVVTDNTSAAFPTALS